MKCNAYFVIFNTSIPVLVLRPFSSGQWWPECLSGDKQGDLTSSLSDTKGTADLPAISHSTYCFHCTQHLCDVAVHSICVEIGTCTCAGIDSNPLFTHVYAFPWLLGGQLHLSWTAWTVVSCLCATEYTCITEVSAIAGALNSHFYSGPLFVLLYVPLDTPI